MDGSFSDTSVVCTAQFKSHIPEYSILSSKGCERLGSPLGVTRTEKLEASVKRDSHPAEVFSVHTLVPVSEGFVRWRFHVVGMKWRSQVDFSNGPVDLVRFETVVTSNFRNRVKTVTHT